MTLHCETPSWITVVTDLLDRLLASWDVTVGDASRTFSFNRSGLFKVIWKVRWRIFRHPSLFSLFLNYQNRKSSLNRFSNMWWTQRSPVWCDWLPAGLKNLWAWCICWNPDGLSWVQAFLWSFTEELRHFFPDYQTEWIFFWKTIRCNLQFFLDAASPV